MTRGAAALAAFAVLFGCSSRVLVGAPHTTGAAGNAGSSSPADAGSGGANAADAGSPPSICKGLSGHRPDQLALLGQTGGDLVFVNTAGSIRRVPGPGSQVIYQERQGWVAAYDIADPTAYHVQLFDASGELRADAAGADALNKSGKPVGIGGLTILSDGTTTVSLGVADQNPVLSPDGRVRFRPYFTMDPDARGWVSATLHSDTSILGVPAFLNVETGETRSLSYLAAGDDWAPIVSGARRLYLAEMNGQTILVDESVDDVIVNPLPGWPRAGLEVDTVTFAGGGMVAYVGLWDSVRKNVPIWFYDPATRTLSSALPDGTLPSDAQGTWRGDRTIDVSTAGARAWGVDLATGVILDYRGGLAVRPTRQLTASAPDWVVLPDNQKKLFRYDRAGGTVQSLNLTGDVYPSGNRVLVMRDGRPREVVRVDDGSIIEIAGGDSLASADPLLAGRWAAGFQSSSQPWNAASPRWRVDLDTGDARPFPAPDAALQMLSGNPGARRLDTTGNPLLSDGRVGLLLYDGLGFSLHVGGPDASWQTLGRAVRSAEWIGWAAGPAFVIAAERTCSCYGPINVPWPAVPSGAPEVLSGTSVQFVGQDGRDLFPPAPGEQFVAFSDAGNTCALVRSDQGDWAIYDLLDRERLALGNFDQLAWIADSP